MAEEATAPAEANVQAPESVTTPTNDNVAAPSTTPYLDKMSEEDRTSIDKFLANNGGIEAFNKWKQSVSNPAPKVEEKPEEPVAAPQPAQQEAPKTSEGYITPTEIAALQYNNMLAGSEQYSGISEYIQKGEYINEMRAFGIEVVDQYGNLNNNAIRKFLDLKAQTVAAQAPASPVTTSTPTVNYADVGETITSQEDALKVLSENGHPKHDEALAFMRKGIFGSK